MLAEGHDVMSPKANEEHEDYQKRLQEYLKTAQDIKKSDLANYVFHRKVILDLLGKAIQKKDDGKYAREDMIHNLIMPMRTDSNQIRPEANHIRQVAGADADVRLKMAAGSERHVVL